MNIYLIFFNYLFLDLKTFKSFTNCSIHINSLIIFIYINN